MKSWKKVFALLACGLFVLACPVFTYLDVNRGFQEQPMKIDAPVPAVDVRQAEQEKVEKLRSAPWQGLRFLPDAREWRFYAIAGEKRKINLIAPFDLVRVYILQPDGHLSSTWVTEGVEIAGQGYYTAASAPVTEGDLVEVAVAGDYVYQTGVDWEACESEYCHLAQMIDTTLILDDKGTGITNGFIRYGWQPPSYPMYGFLVWQIRPYNGDRVQVSTKWH
jgi:hypothetical protein